MKQFGLDERSWFQMAQNRDQWRAACKEGVKKCTEVGQKKDSERRQNFPIALEPSAQFTHPLVCRTCFRTSKGNKILPDINARQQDHEEALEVLSESSKCTTYALSTTSWQKGITYCRWPSFKVQDSRCVCVCVCMCVYVCVYVCVTS